MLLDCIAFFLCGPSQLLYFPDRLDMMCLGQLIAGAMHANLLTPCMLEMIESALVLFPGRELEANVIGAGAFNSALGISFLISPIYGSIVN